MAHGGVLRYNQDSGVPAEAFLDQEAFQVRMREEGDPGVRR